MSAKIINLLRIRQKYVQGLPIHFEKIDTQGRSWSIEKHHRLMQGNVSEPRLLHHSPDSVFVSCRNHEVYILCGPGYPVMIDGMAPYHHNRYTRRRQTAGNNIKNYIHIKFHIFSI